MPRINAGQANKNFDKLSRHERPTATIPSAVKSLYGILRSALQPVLTRTLKTLYCRKSSLKNSTNAIF